MRDALGAGRVGRASRAEYAGGAVLPGPARSCPAQRSGYVLKSAVLESGYKWAVGI